MTLSALGGPVQALFVTDYLARRSDASGAIRITGEDGFLVTVHAATIQELEDTLDKFLMHGQTISSLVVSTPVAPRSLPVHQG